MAFAIPFATYTIVNTGNVNSANIAIQACKSSSDVAGCILKVTGEPTYEQRLEESEMSYKYAAERRKQMYQICSGGGLYGSSYQSCLDS